MYANITRSLIRLYRLYNFTMILGLRVFVVTLKPFTLFSFLLCKLAASLLPANTGITVVMAELRRRYSRIIFTFKTFSNKLDTIKS